MEEGFVANINVAFSLELVRELFSYILKGSCVNSNRSSRLFRGLALLSMVGAATLATAPAAMADAGGTPAAPALGHIEGVVPAFSHQSATGAANGATTKIGSGGPLYYGGNPIVPGTPKVYLVFWGSQWGTETAGATNAAGVTLETFSGDPAGMAPYLENFVSGLGTGSDALGASTSWSSVMEQYCQGVRLNATSCTGSVTHVGAATTGTLAGIWYDNASAVSNNATQTQLQNEANAAASHFGTTSASAQFVIVSPTGTHPAGFNTSSAKFCAWHSWSGSVAYTNLPYIPDMGGSCGAGFVNGSNGALDGVSIVEGHEYAETLTDPYAGGGWVASNGYENGDLCAWLLPNTGGSGDINLATGSFAMQSTWSNQNNSCEMSLPSTVVGPASSLVLTTGSSLSAKAGQTWSTSPSVAVEDASGNIVTTTTGTVTATVTSGPSATFTGTTSVSLNAGVATFPGLKLSGTAGSYVVTFAVTVGSSTFSAPLSVTLTAGTAFALTAVAQQVNQSHTLALSPGPSVTVVDQWGNKVSGVSVTLRLASNSSGASFTYNRTSYTTLSTTSSSTGVAAFSGVAISKAGTFSLGYAVSSPALTATSNSFTLS